MLYFETPSSLNFHIILSELASTSQIFPLFFFFAGHPSPTQPLCARLSWGPVLGSIFPLKPIKLSSALYPVVDYKGFLYLAEVYKIIYSRVNVYFSHSYLVTVVE